MMMYYFVIIMKFAGNSKVHKVESGDILKSDNRIASATSKLLYVFPDHSYLWPSKKNEHLTPSSGEIGLPNTNTLDISKIRLIFL